MDLATAAPAGNSLTPQSVLLVVLIAVAVWAVVELALTLRKARQSVDELTRSVDETIDQVQPLIAKVDGALDELQPATQEVQPLVEKVELAVDEANVALAKVNGILGDVSELSGTASSVTNSVKSATSAAASGVASLVDRMVGSSRGKDKGVMPAMDAPSVDDDPTEELERLVAPAASSGYITYGAGKVTAEGMGDVRADAGSSSAVEGAGQNGIDA